MEHSNAPPALPPAPGVASESTSLAAAIAPPLLEAAEVLLRQVQSYPQ